METPAHSARSREPQIADALHKFLLPRRDGKTKSEKIAIRLADQFGERANANMLIDRNYSRIGYGEGHGIPQSFNSVSFTASSKSKVVGTLTLTVDSPHGLATETTFPGEVAALRRQPGVQLCELTKLAVDLTGASLPMLAAMFHIIFIYGTKFYSCTDLIIEVIPRHARFYEVMLGFDRASDKRVNAAVGVETQMMILKVSQIRKFIDEHSGKFATRSLYPYFFSKDEEIGIFRRITPPELIGMPEPMPCEIASAPAILHAA